MASHSVLQACHFSPAARERPARGDEDPRERRGLFRKYAPIEGGAVIAESMIASPNSPTLRAARGTTGHAEPAAVGCCAR